MDIYYDFHIHSALSPCGSLDMTPNNIINMASLKGLDVIALTDHNACGNCAAVMELGRRAGLIVLPGMELCTAEEAHVLCLFPKLDNALEFDKYVKEHIIKVKNKPDVFGQQCFMDENDEITGYEEYLLLTATSISIDNAAKLAGEYGGVAIPSHIDRPAYSVISSLGFIAPEMGFHTLELSCGTSKEDTVNKYPYLNKGYRFIRDSDAHSLEFISERENCIETNGKEPEQIISALSIL
ncbi:MAG: PHP domain-containing protein [Bacillota bacterium]|nr:PHP domain-containing protein [Bacillota bacterium]